MSWRSNAIWPYPDIELGVQGNITTDLHWTEKEARTVVDNLKIDGFSGYGEIFPAVAWVCLCCGEENSEKEEPSDYYYCYGDEFI